MNAKSVCDAIRVPPVVNNFFRNESGWSRGKIKGLSARVRDPFLWTICGLKPDFSYNSFRFSLLLFSREPLIQTINSRRTLSRSLLENCCSSCTREFRKNFHGTRGKYQQDWLRAFFRCFFERWLEVICFDASAPLILWNFDAWVRDLKQEWKRSK